jgi:hypothetical protein
MRLTMTLGAVLGIVFVVLKLCGVIAWSWFWVTAPLWIEWALLIVGLSVFFLVFHKPARKPNW